ncbi:MAG: hypothetical protein HUJ76_09200 [Parasporobacterium sp.]|nr:hypothetical protein [Parasporobacterium sp.]
MTKIEFIPRHMRTLKHFSNVAKGLFAGIRMIESESMPPTFGELDTTLERAETLSNHLRQMMLDEMERLHPGEDNYMKITSVSVRSEVSEDCIRVFIPVTFRRNRDECNYLARLVDLELMKQENLYGSITPPVYIIVRRKVMRGCASVCDNENLEVSKVINTIFRHMGFPDSADMAAYCSQIQRVERADEQGTEITVISCRKLEDAPECFRFWDAGTENTSFM